MSWTPESEEAWSKTAYVPPDTILIVDGRAIEEATKVTLSQAMGEDHLLHRWRHRGINK